jgi:hypothetical protein
MCEKVFAYFFRRHVSKKFQEEELEEHLRKVSFNLCCFRSGMINCYLQMVTASEDIVTTFRNFIDWLKQKVENVPRPEGKEFLKIYKKSEFNTCFSRKSVSSK